MPSMTMPTLRPRSPRPTPTAAIFGSRRATRRSLKLDTARHLLHRVQDRLKKIRNRAFRRERAAAQVAEKVIRPMRGPSWQSHRWRVLGVAPHASGPSRSPDRSGRLQRPVSPRGATAPRIFKQAPPMRVERPARARIRGRPQASGHNRSVSSPTQMNPRAIAGPFRTFLFPWDSGGGAVAVPFLAQEGPDRIAKNLILDRKYAQAAEVLARIRGRVARSPTAASSARTRSCWRAMPRRDRRLRELSQGFPRGGRRVARESWDRGGQAHPA